MPEPLHRSSIADSLEQAADHLRRAGVLNARREATALWAALARVPPGDVWLGRDDEADASVADRFWAAVEQRAGGVPFPYVVGHVAFRTLQLHCDPRALIPRPETEGLVALVLEWAQEGGGRGKGGIAADVGTGTGCIALALAVEGPFERVIAVERSPQAAALARENVALVRPRVPVEVREGELLEPLAGARCRAIVSNPPYVTAAEYDALDPAVREHEPRAALVSGADGLATTRALFAGAAALLAPDGVLALEIDERRGDAVRALAQEHGWARIGIHDDWFGRPRYALAFPKEDA